MLAPKSMPPMSLETFLAFVDAHPGEKWELIDGQPVAMGGGVLRHALIAANIAEALAQPARARGCRVLRDMFFRIAANDGHVFDPDVMVRCGAGDLGARTIEDAVAAFEVLSPSTMNYDRGVKVDAYLQAPALLLVAIVYQSERRVEAWARSAAGAPWPEAPLILSHAGILPISPLDTTLDLARIYEGVDAEA